MGVQKREDSLYVAKRRLEEVALSWGICGKRLDSSPALRPLCSCRFFGCRRCCLWPPAFCCFPEPCCPWPLEAPRLSPLPPRAPATFRDRFLQPLSLAPTRKSPKRSPGGDHGKMIVKGELGEGEKSATCYCRPLEACLWASVTRDSEWGLHLQGCGGEAPSGLRQSHPSDHIHVSRKNCRVNLTWGVGWEPFSWRNFFPSQDFLPFFSCDLQL